MELLSNTRQLKILGPSEGNNMLFITGYNGLSTKDDSTKDDIMAVNNFYALLIVYLNCFCTSVFFFVLSGLSGFRKGVHVGFSEGVDFVHTTTAFFVEDKECIYKLFFLQKERVEYNLSKNRVAIAQLWQRGFLLHFINDKITRDKTLLCNTVIL